MMPLCPVSKFYEQALDEPGREVPNMLNPVSTSDSRQDPQSLLVQKKAQQKKQDEVRDVRNNQPSTPNAQRTDNTEQNQARPEIQNSQQAKGASLDLKA